MATEYIYLIALGCLAGGFCLALYLNQKEGETADQVQAANAREPIFFEQQFPTSENAIATKEQAEAAIAMLIKTGNKYIVPKLYPHGDVFLWIHGADKANTTADFWAWRWANIPRRAKIVEGFRATKVGYAKTQEDMLKASMLWTTDEPNQN